MARRRTMLGPAKPLAETGCCVRRSRVVLTPRCWRQVCGGAQTQPGLDVPYSQTTVTTKPGRRGEREVSRKTIARGMPGDFRCDRGDYARVLCFISHARLRVHRAPGIPCALCFAGRTVLQNSGASRREIVESYLNAPSLRGA